MIIGSDSEVSLGTPYRTSGGRVMLVDDALEDADVLADLLRPDGIELVSAGSAEEALRLLNQQSVDVVVADLSLPGASGLELTRALRQRDDPIPVIVVTGSTSISHAIHALKLGASDYLQKPVVPAQLIALVRAILRSEDAIPEVAGGQPISRMGPVFEGMLGASAAMQEVFGRIVRVAQTSAPVLIVGESGTGKELVARALHNQSPRKNGPFIPVHTGAIPKELVSSELFGHERGAFTGADSTRDGKFAAAQGGTLFLDEIGTMDLPTQISLLRVLETFRYTRVGSNREQKADVRIVAATNSDLLDLVDQGRFREDLFYRLNVFAIALPALRERGEDIATIAKQFLGLACQRYGLPAKSLSEEAVNRLRAYFWPGNIRELRNSMDQAAVLARGDVVGADELELVRARLPSRMLRAPEFASAIPAEGPYEACTPMEAPRDSPPAEPSPRFSMKDDAIATAVVDPSFIRVLIGTPLAEVERLLIMRTLGAASGNKQRAARILGISRRGLYARLAAYGEKLAPAETLELSSQDGSP